MPDPAAAAEKLARLHPRELHVVCMPDFFLDHFVEMTSWDEATRAMRRVHDQGGGNLPGHPQRFQPGGNAANTALALARLGARTHLVARTSPFGRLYLEETLGRAGVDLSRVKADGELAVTTALEFEAPDGRGRRNVMLNWSGSVADFGPERLDANDWTLVEGCDAVLVSNWVQNRRGTELAEAVARAARDHGARVFLDTGDPSTRASEVGALAKGLLLSPDVSVVGLNENEARQFAKALGVAEPDALGCAAALAKLRAHPLDLHTADYTATWGPEGHAMVPTFRVKERRATGAGDAWNAGDVLGHLAGLPPGERLLVANAVAALYVAGDDGRHPRLEDVVGYLRSDPPLREPAVG